MLTAAFKNVKGATDRISYHRFPTSNSEAEKVWRQQWIYFMKRDDIRDPHQDAFLCSAHFTPESWSSQKFSLTGKGRNRLKNDAFCIFKNSMKPEYETLGQPYTGSILSRQVANTSSNLNELVAFFTKCKICAGILGTEFDELHISETGYEDTIYGATFCLTWTSAKISLPPAFIFSRCAVPGRALVEIYKDVINMVEAAGFYVVVTTSDSGSTNVCALASLGVGKIDGYGNPASSFQLDGKLIYHNWDPCHLIKNVWTTFIAVKSVTWIKEDGSLFYSASNPEELSKAVFAEMLTHEIRDMEETLSDAMHWGSRFLNGGVEDQVHQSLIYYVAGYVARRLNFTGLGCEERTRALLITNTSRACPDYVTQPYALQ